MNYHLHLKSLTNSCFSLLLEVLRRIMELIYHTLIRIAELIIIQTSFKNMIFHEEHRFEIKLRQENIASCEIRLLSIKLKIFSIVL